MWSLGGECPYAEGGQFLPSTRGQCELSVAKTNRPYSSAPSHINHNPVNLQSHHLSDTLTSTAPDRLSKPRDLSIRPARPHDRHVSRQPLPRVLTSSKCLSRQARPDLDTTVEDAPLPHITPAKARFPLISHTRRKITTGEAGTDSTHR